MKTTSFYPPIVAALLLLLASSPARAAPCSSTKMAEVLAPATSAQSYVRLGCDLSLRATDVVTKRLVMIGSSASNVTVDCNGAVLDGGPSTVNFGRDMVEIHSEKVGPDSWQRPRDVTVRDCRIVGSVRIWGMAKNGEGADLRASSRQEGHVSRARSNAPTRITLEDLTITGVSRIPLYIAPGVTYTTLLNSEIRGDSASVALYLDAESSQNTFRNNYIHPTTTRELIAVDGSSYNRFIDNWFSSLSRGGIYLYRNCGEGGTIRHSTPSNNEIINNVFYYNKYTGSNPAVFLGARNGNRSYCGEDAGYPYGSSVSNLDFARYNAVMQNQIYKRSISDMIRAGASSDSRNVIKYNTTVTQAVSRSSGCYVTGVYRDDFLLHGEVASVLEGSRGAPSCGWYGIRCEDGDRETILSPPCAPIRTVDFQCQVTGSNTGCSGSVACSSGERIIGQVAACNLEWGTVSSTQLASIPVNTIDVLRASDNVSAGLCYVANNQRSSGRGPATSALGLSSTTFGCREHDSNGGDCHIRGQLYCQ